LTSLVFNSFLVVQFSMTFALFSGVPAPRRFIIISRCFRTVNLKLRGNPFFLYLFRQYIFGQLWLFLRYLGPADIIQE